MGGVGAGDGKEEIGLDTGLVKLGGKNTDPRRSVKQLQ